MTNRIVNFGVIGCGLMGREFASAAARWLHLANPKTGDGFGVEPRIVAVCDANPDMMQWFTKNVPSVALATTDYRELLADPSVEAVYCAVPHNLHAQIYVDILDAGKHLLGEKPFGIDLEANRIINEAIAAHPNLLVRVSSEFPFYPGAYQIARWATEGRFGRIIEVEAGFWHSSDLNPQKPINWKRMVEINGEYGCMGDLGLHVVHVPFRAGWLPANVRALLANVMTHRPNAAGEMVEAGTWDNAILATEAQTGEQSFPMVLSTKRIAPGHMDSWFVRVWGTEFSAEYTTRQPRTLRTMPYEPGGPQAWHVEDVGYKSAYPTITGGIFEFGLPDALLQMWAAYLDELAHTRGGMRQPFACATPQEAARSHRLFTAALESHATGSTVALD